MKIDIFFNKKTIILNGFNKKTIIKRKCCE